MNEYRTTREVITALHESLNKSKKYHNWQLLSSLTFLLPIGILLVIGDPTVKHQLQVAIGLCTLCLTFSLRIGAYATIESWRCRGIRLIGKPDKRADNLETFDKDMRKSSNRLWLATAAGVIMCTSHLAQPIATLDWPGEILYAVSPGILFYAVITNLLVSNRIFKLISQTPIFNLND